MEGMAEGMKERREAQSCMDKYNDADFCIRLQEANRKNRDLERRERDMARKKREMERKERDMEWEAAQLERKMRKECKRMGGKWRFDKCKF